MRQHIIIASLIAALAALCGCGTKPVTADASDPGVPELYPDYAGVTFPRNICAPTFEVNIPDADAIQVQIGLPGQDPEIVVNADDQGAVIIPLKEWHAMADKLAGSQIAFKVLSRKQGRWYQHPDITADIDTAAIDPWLAYRLIYPGYQLWSRVGIYQRDLTSYTQCPILENKDFDADCLNCHSFSANNPETMHVHVRGKNGGTIIKRNGKSVKVSPKADGINNNATYVNWHRDGRHIVYSANKVRQGFNNKGAKPIEVVDLEADLLVYDTETGIGYTDSLVASAQHMETFAAWQPGTDVIYYCRTEKPYEEYEDEQQIKYSLWRVPFNISTHTFGTPECVYDAAAQGKSVSFPRFTPDGRFMMFTLSDFGNFSIWHPESDLWIMDMADGSMRPLVDANSDDVDSYHNWASDGRWFVFSSKRLDGLCARPFIARFDPATGRSTKAFVLPQKHPRYYDDQPLTYNIPELITGPVTDTDALLNTVRTK